MLHQLIILTYRLKYLVSVVRSVAGVMSPHLFFRPRLIENSVTVVRNMFPSSHLSDTSNTLNIDTSFYVTWVKHIFNLETIRVARIIRMTSSATSTSTTLPKYNVAIIGGGITGATAAQTLAKYDNVNIHLFDQGRSGVGGRTSTRAVNSNTSDKTNTNTDNKSEPSMRWDHGCQFFRADTDKFKLLVKDWMTKGFIQEWKGNFMSSPSASPSRDFFGLPSHPPFYVGADGMQSISKGILHHILNTQNKDNDKDNGDTCPQLNLFTGTRVAQLERDKESNRWKLFGTSGTAAFHDTPEKTVQQSNDKIQLGAMEGYDAIILTDVSSSFGQWHRASAGVPESFASKVRERVGSRVPLFTAMIAFETESGIPFDAATFDHDVIWFASKSNAKPGMEGESENNKSGMKMKECWTLVSTPEYAMDKIEETPMQDSITGDFIPQSKDYLTTVPGPDLIKAFCNDLTSKDGILGDNALSLSLVDIPKVVHVDAQRWGSAMPTHRHLDDSSQTRKVLSGVAYDSGRSPLAPTKLEECRRGDGQSFLMDDNLMLFQAGDMMSNYTPGFESAAISGSDAATCLWSKISS